MKNVSEETDSELDKCLIFGNSQLILKKFSSEGSNVYDILKDVIEGNYIKVLQNELFLHLYKEIKSLIQSTNFGFIIIKYLNDFLSSNPTRNEEVFMIGQACYQLFLQINWTGPHLSTLDLDVWGTSCEVIESLVNDIDCISRKVLNPELLAIAYAVFSCDKIMTNTRLWWKIRMLSTLQSLLIDLSHDIKITIEESFKKIENGEWTIKEEEVLYRLEQCKIYLSHYGNISKASSSLNKAMTLLGLQHSLVGAMGKRTKYQVKEFAQLTLNVLSKDIDTNEHHYCVDHLCNTLPTDCLLDDENRLNDIKFSNEVCGQFPTLNSLQQAAILNSLMLEQKSKPKDDLQKEELQPFIRCLLQQKSVWSIHVSALLQRSLLESDNRRSVQRAMQQIETLISSINMKTPLIIDRLYLFHCSFVTPSWQLQAYLGNLFLSIGAIQSALDCFLESDMWEECVACYNVQGLKHKAAEILEKELKSENMTKAKHILILCLLGDATDNISLYEEAWKISDFRSSRVQKHWAFYYYSRKEYEKSIEHFKASLKINSLQDQLWFRLGFACMTEEKWVDASEAYRRYCDLENDCFEAWNNLAKCYIKNGQKSRAYYALKEAVKCNYENWMVWDNLMVVSVDCGCFEEAIKCYHRLIDLKNKHVDLEVLQILVNAVQNDVKDENNRPVSDHKKSLLQLFGRLTSQVQNDGKIWKLYADLEASNSCPNKEIADKVLHHFQCAHRFTTQGNKWAQNTDVCLSVISLSMELANAYVSCFNNVENVEQKRRYLSSAKLMLVSVLSQIEKEQGILDGVKEDYEKLKNELDQIKLRLATEL
ncbi:tetratricopeptide repeat protein 27 [Daktulosphaira vitifoliae]|uniref:tetratricopeptide repeat protein 27 n=1 Tax=Daktulosphaira vitifoliae TaxID=58002 RepID=UPI0021AAE82B|nr:tetratricopeptide repeat protein 27 [Daktulosphaira vitifoliae]